MPTGLMRSRVVRGCLAWAALLSAAPAAAQTFELECENEDRDTMSIAANQPITRVSVQIVRITVDPAARRAVFRAEADDGSPITAVRELLVIDDSELITCQADACQREVLNGEIAVTTSLTRIDLRTGELSRRVSQHWPNPSGGPRNERTVIRSGTCRRV